VVGAEIPVSMLRTTKITNQIKPVYRPLNMLAAFLESFWPQPGTGACGTTVSPLGHQT